MAYLPEDLRNPSPCKWGGRQSRAGAATAQLGKVTMDVYAQAHMPAKRKVVEMMRLEAKQQLLSVGA
jgi:hypothetical protein